MSDSCLLPEFDSDEAAGIAAELFAIEGSLRQLDGERDLNFLIETAQGKFVFKIANALESAAMLECQHEVFRRLAAAEVMPAVATALESVNGSFIESVTNAQGDRHYCRVLPFIEGRLLSEFSEPDPRLLDDLGHRLALLDQALDSFSHPGLDRPLLWNMEQGLSLLEDYKPLLATAAQRDLVEHFEHGYRDRVNPRRHELRRAVIHNDANRGNVLADAAGLRIVSFIDFGDMLHGWLLAEPAIAAAYAMLDQANPLRVAQDLLRGYHRTLPLTEMEISLFFDLVCMRLCMSVCIGAHQCRLDPDNEYLGIDARDSWVLLDQLQKYSYAETRDLMLAACDSQ